MIARLLLLATLVNHAASFTKSDGVIELNNVAEFNKAVDEFDLLVVEFYAPVSTPLEPPCRWSPQRWPPVTTGPASQWCKACQKLAPTYSAAADIMAKFDTPIATARVGLPTLCAIPVADPACPPRRWTSLYLRTRNSRLSTS
jgi:hypothetical protein